jgi:gluconate 2-dehydrogenase gamma chain
MSRREPPEPPDSFVPDESAAPGASSTPDESAAPGASSTPLPSRRRALAITAGVIGGSAVAALVIRRGEPATPAQPPEPQRAPQFAARLFSREQALIVEDLAELIIPETNSPGAVQAEVPAFIEGIVREVYDEPERLAFLRGIDELDARAREKHGRPFFACAPGERAALVEPLVQHEASLPENTLAEGAPWSFFKAFHESCIEGFCQSRLGATRVLQYDSVPGAYHGCVPLESIGRAWATS